MQSVITHASLAQEFYHSGLWSDCGPMGCVHDNTNSARGYVRVARAFAILLIVFSFSLSFIHLPIVAAIAGRRAGRAHSNNAKFAGMCWLFTAACGIISMSAFYDRRSRELLFDRSINHVFWDWSFGTFTAAWALALGLVAPLCFIAA
jgi:hypothetical protein